MSFKVPGNVVEGKGTPFPQGSYVGKLSKVESVWSSSDRENAPDQKDNMDFVLTFGENAPADSETAQVGARPFTQRVAIINRGNSMVDITEFNDDTSYPLRLAAGLIAQLAVALDAPCTVSADKSVEFDVNAFLEGLQAGLYQNKPCGFTVTHRAWKSKKTGNSGVSADTSRFFAVEESENVTAPLALADARTRN